MVTVSFVPVATMHNTGLSLEPSFTKERHVVLQRSCTCSEIRVVPFLLALPSILAFRRSTHGGPVEVQVFIQESVRVCEYAIAIRV